MKILLLSMPDSFEHMPEPVVRMPNGALTSLAGNVDSHHRVAVADFIVRGEGEITFRELLRAIEHETGYENISGLSYRSGKEFRHNPERAVSRLDNEAIKLPNRKARVLSGYTMIGRPVDVVETSR